MLQYHFEGLKELIKATEPVLLVEPLRKFFKSATVVVQGEARHYAPSDTGHLRNMIVTEIDAGRPPIWGKVGVLKAEEGTPLWFKARAMEYGTGSQGDPEVSHKSGHWPPGEALAVWGKRHGGISGYAVAAAIGRRGGLKGRKYLRIGFALSLDRIKGLLRQVPVDVVREWAKRVKG
jgi:hypothetical protein